MNGNTSTPSISNGSSTTSLSPKSNTSTSSTTNQHLPLTIAGGGCTGLLLALLLSHSPSLPSHQRIIVLEPHAPDPRNTRAIAHQPSTFPIIAKVPGLLEELVAKGELGTGLCFRTGIGVGGEDGNVIAGREFPKGMGKGGFPMGQLILPQGQFQEVLLARLKKMDNVEVRLGTRLKSFTQHENYVEIHTSTSASSSTPTTFKSLYLLAADGAHSPTRHTLSIPFPGTTLSYTLIATDIRLTTPPPPSFYAANFIIDPQHYGLVSLISSSTASCPALWRVSYGIPSPPSGEEAGEEEIRKEVESRVEAMLPSYGKDEQGRKVWEVVNIAPYKAQQRCAETFWTGRVGLVGDAAHLTNPYAGLGLASGMADASSLAEVLVRVLSGEAKDSEKLLMAWSDARRAVFNKFVDPVSRAAFARVRSDVSSEEKVRALVEGDKMLQVMKGGGPLGGPSIETRGESLEGW